MFPLLISQLNINLTPSLSLQDNAYDMQSIVLKKLINSNAVIIFSYIHPSSSPKMHISPIIISGWSLKKSQEFI